jgi:cell division protein ZapE
MTPLNNYNELVASGAIVKDDAQVAIMQELDVVARHLVHENQRRKKITSLIRKPKTVKGMYLSGGVGIGKTFMMDCLYKAIPFKNKLRMHFHVFMRMIHRELKLKQGKKNPVKLIAADLAKKYMLICFDEFIVTDITDAMLLGRLLEGLFANGVTLIATSNVHPDDLYKRGLQRDQFIPAIELIKRHTLVKQMLSTADYRLRHLDHAGVFYVPNDDLAAEEMEKSFLLLAHQQVINVLPIEICGRKIAVKQSVDNIVWFDFKAICRPPRSQHDYLQIAEQYNTVFISDIPVFSSTENDSIFLFIRLIDVFYDAHIRLVLSAEKNIEELYVSGRMLFEYARTCSRLREMQSDHYFYKSK